MSTFFRNNTSDNLLNKFGLSKSLLKRRLQLLGNKLFKKCALGQPVDENEIKLRTIHLNRSLNINFTIKDMIAGCKLTAVPSETEDKDLYNQYKIILEQFEDLSDDDLENLDLIETKVPSDIFEYEIKPYTFQNWRLRHQLKHIARLNSNLPKIRKLVFDSHSVELFHNWLQTFLDKFLIWFVTGELPFNVALKKTLGKNLYQIAEKHIKIFSENRPKYDIDVDNIIEYIKETKPKTKTLTYDELSYLAVTINYILLEILDLAGANIETDLRNDLIGCLERVIKYDDDLNPLFEE